MPVRDIECLGAEYIRFAFSAADSPPVLQQIGVNIQILLTAKSLL